MSLRFNPASLCSEVRLYSPMGLPVRDPTLEDHPKVKELRAPWCLQELGKTWKTRSLDMTPVHLRSLGPLLASRLVRPYPCGRKVMFGAARRCMEPLLVLSRIRLTGTLESLAQVSPNATVFWSCIFGHIMTISPSLIANGCFYVINPWPNSGGFILAAAYHLFLGTLQLISQGLSIRWHLDEKSDLW